MWPWDWVIAAGQWISGVSQSVYNWVTRLVTSVTDWATNAFNAVWTYLGTLVSYIASVWDRTVMFVNTLAAQVWAIIAKTGQDISNWVTGIWNDLWKYAKSAWDWSVQAVDKIYHWIDYVVNAVYSWVQREVWQPLKRAWDDFTNWASGWITRIWQYIEHPELLVKLLGSFLLSMWTSYIRQFGITLTRWFIRNMRGLAGEVFDLIEYILSAII